jgi:tRNA G18 (ribose-2'-O)-methylase SpoU
MQPIYLVLHNIRSVHNVGAIFRTADAGGVAQMILCGVTPTPVDRFGRERKDIAKTALGAEKTVPWVYTEDIQEAMTDLKAKKVTVVSLEQAEGAVPYNKYKNNKPTAFILGEETKGLPANILKHSDAIVEIPMYGKKESLNVSVATGILLFRFLEEKT